MRRIIIFLLTVLSSTRLLASGYEADSLVTKSKTDKPFETVAIGLPLVVSGVVLKHYDNNLSNSQTSYSEFHNAKADDYLRFAPGILMYGLKLAGVESSSSWKKMIVADAFSSALMVGSVEVLKRTTDYRRPDGSDCRSFPSGHSAVAFMMATMLHKEYGDISPFYSIGGYAIATYTSVSRAVSNRHWTSDVLCGAGIGILSTEIGYYLSELIFKENSTSDVWNYTDDNSKFKIGLELGLSLPCSSLRMSDSSVLKLGNGTASGISFSYSVNKYLDLTGQLNYNLFPIIKNDEFISNNLQNINALAGVSGRYWFRNGVGVEARILGGYNNFLETSVDDLNIGGKGGLILKSGLSFNVKPYQNIEMQLFADYNLSGSFMKGYSKKTNFFTIGTSAIFNF